MMTKTPGIAWGFLLEKKMILYGRGRPLDISTPQIMGILNVTPDSFSDGSKFNEIDKALKHAEAMIAEGATIIDIGGESTRPGAEYVTAQQELERVIPVIEAIAKNIDVMISIDTYKSVVMHEACKAGAHLINDIKALQDDGAVEIAAQSDALVCVMHMQGDPQTMQINPKYSNIVDEVTDFLNQRVKIALDGGVAKEKLILDPGFGFGKTTEQNFELLGRVSQVCSDLQLPMLIGVSRKSMIGNYLQKDVDHRLFGSVGAALYAVGQGACIIRVHDVAATADAVKVFFHAQQYNQ